MGEGTFKAGQGAQPAIGQLGVSERVVEIRFETVVPANRVAAAVQAFIDCPPL